VGEKGRAVYEGEHRDRGTAAAAVGDLLQGGALPGAKEQEFEFVGGQEEVLGHRICCDTGIHIFKLLKRMQEGQIVYKNCQIINKKI
jgi:hypothetical protein